MKNVLIKIRPSGLNDVCLIAIDKATDSPVEHVVIVRKRDAIKERERFGSRLLNRSDVASVEAQEIPSWAKC